MINVGAILVIEDTHTSLKLITDILAAEGYQVHPADSGELALASVEAMPPELILLDIIMPGMDGFEVLRRLKAREETCEIPVIILSAITEVGKRVEGLKLGAVDFISKPFQAEELLARVRSHLELFRLRARLEQQAAELRLANEQLRIDIARRKQAEEALKQAKDELEHRVAERTEELSRANEGLQQEITGRNQAEVKILASLREKDILLSEIHHRVKNNLQVISGLLSLQAKRSKNSELIGSFRKSQERIQAMALVHEKLYKSHDLSRIDLVGYVRSLSEELFQTYNIHPGKIDLTFQPNGKVYMDIIKAIPCGLIMNELISNALKHAFPGDGTGKLQIIIRETKDREIEIVVRDNGVGLPDDVDILKPRSVGLHLVNGLTKNQLDGQIEVKRDNGTEFRITFPL